MHTLTALVRSQYIGTLLRRAFILWLLVRLTVMILLAFGRSSGVIAPPSLLLPPATIALVVILVAMLAQTDARIVRETLFFANLGLPTYTPAAFAAACVPAFEFAVAVIFRMLS